jgi:hypothetical protein
MRLTSVKKASLFTVEPGSDCFYFSLPDFPSYQQPIIEKVRPGNDESLMTDRENGALPYFKVPASEMWSERYSPFGAGG